MPSPLAEGQRKFICFANDFSLASGQGGGQTKWYFISQTKWYFIFHNSISFFSQLLLTEPYYLIRNSKWYFCPGCFVYNYTSNAKNKCDNTFSSSGITSISLENFTRTWCGWTRTRMYLSCRFSKKRVMENANIG